MFLDLTVKWENVKQQTPSIYSFSFHIEWFLITNFILEYTKNLLNNKNIKESFNIRINIGLASLLKPSKTYANKIYIHSFLQDKE
jgi:hypothetical protein